jgi:TPR repeat protein
VGRGAGEGRAAPTATLPNGQKRGNVRCAGESIAAATLILGVAFAGSVTAGPFEDGAAAYDRGDYGTAVRLFWALDPAKVDPGNVSVQFGLGMMYLSGWGVPQDRRAAVPWLRKAADQGLAVAQRVLGDMYARGEGVSLDSRAAASWYRKAANQGNADAQTGLGLIYYSGNGVSQDYAAAASLFRRAADQGNELAQHYLGLLYSKGWGVQQDYVIAHMWYNLAAAAAVMNACEPTK